HVADFVAIKPRRRAGSCVAPGGEIVRCEGLWFEPLYVDPRDGLLKRTDRLPEARAQRRRPAAAAPPDRIALAFDRELRCIDGLWFEVTLAPLPEPEYREHRELRPIALNWRAGGRPIVEMEMKVRRLATPAVVDVVAGALVPAGPDTDESSA